MRTSIRLFLSFLLIPLSFHVRAEERKWNNMIACIENGVSWGYFDYREKDEPFEEGFQNPPVDWNI